MRGWIIFLVSNTLTARCTIEKLPLVLSDHNPLLLSIEFDSAIRNMKTWTFERALLINEKYCDYMRQWIPRFLEENIGSASIEIVWDVLKAGIRGETLRFSLNANKAKQEMKVLQNNKVMAE